MRATCAVRVLFWRPVSCRYDACKFMAPKDENFLPKSSLGIVPPTTRIKNGGMLSSDMWIEERKQVDGAEGLWRIHDKLYDFTSFVHDHPGGSEWLLLTNGTDITEAFEIHHLSELPQKVISKYFVKEAVTKRNVPFTFDEDGFYKTLKREVQNALKVIPKEKYTTSDIYSDMLLLATFITSTLAVKYWSFVLGLVAGIFLGFLTGAGHNYIHRKNSFRMYYFQVSLLQVRDWRISHVLSHHIYTNTVIDLEISMVEPFLQYLPIKKYLGGYASLIFLPFVFMSGFIGSFVRRILGSFSCNYKNMEYMDLTSFLLPAFMYVFGGKTLTYTLVMWFFIITCGSFEFTAIGLSAGHHHPEVFHDGDTPRSLKKFDWGLSQLDAVMDRTEITASEFLVLTSFGNHCLHHLFPTLDHSILKHMYPVLEKVMKQFNVHLRMVSQLETFTGGLKQLIKVDANPLPPDLRKNAWKLY